MIEWLNQLSSSWFSYFSIMTIQNTVFLAAIFVLMYLFRNQSARFLRFLALLGLLKLIVPPVFFPGSAERIAVAFSPIINALPAAGAGTGASAGAAAISLTMSSALFIVWCLGIVGLGIAIGKQWYQTQFLSGIQRHYQVQGMTIPVYCSNDVRTPQVSGIFRPKILVPASWKNLSEEQQQTILTHEVGHIKQRDPYITLLQTAAILVHFYNPLVWILNRRMNYYSEMTCDDYAIDARGISRADYLNNLLSAAESQQVWRGSLIPIWSFSDTFDKLKNRFQYQVNVANRIRRKLTNGQRLLLLLAAAAIIPLSCDYSADTAQSDVNDIASQSMNAAANYDTPPEIVGGIRALHQNVQYPEIAQKAGIEGTVIVRAQISETGEVTATEILKGIDQGGLNEAAVAAVKKTEWKPALSGQKAVSIWYAIPIAFKLQKAEALRLDVTPDNTVQLNGQPVSLTNLHTVLKSRGYTAEQLVRISAPPHTPMEILHHVHSELQAAGLTSVQYSVS